MTLNYNTSQFVNFEVIKDVVLERTEMEHMTVHTEEKIKRKRKAGGTIVSIITEHENKLYKISFSRGGV